MTSTSARWLHGTWQRGEPGVDGYGFNNYIRMFLAADRFEYGTGNRFEGSFSVAPCLWTITFDEQRPDCFRFDFSRRLFRYDETTATLYDVEMGDPIEMVHLPEVDELPLRTDPMTEKEFPVAGLDLSLPPVRFDSAGDQLTCLLGSQPSARRIATLRAGLLDRRWTPLACVSGRLADEPFRNRVLSSPSVQLRHSPAASVLGLP